MSFFTYVLGSSEDSRLLPCPKNLANSDFFPFFHEGEAVANSQGALFVVYVDEAVLPPLIPDVDDPIGLQRAIDGGRYFAVEAEPRIFVVTTENSERTFKA
jgi:hypothetical protein